MNIKCMQFALYDKLLKSKPIKDINWGIICNTINNLPIEHAEIVYMLIFHHFLLEITANKPQVLKKKNYVYPYSSKSPGSAGRGILITIDNLPSILKNVIVSYIYNIISK